MKTREFKVGNKIFRFENRVWGGYSCWGHETKMFENDVFIEEDKCVYMNRTWERYQFQNVMRRCVYKHINNLLSNFLTNYKKENNIKRLVKAKKEELEVEFKQNNTELYELLNLI